MPPVHQRTREAPVRIPAALPAGGSGAPIDEILRQGVERLLARALEVEAEQHVEAHAHLKRENGRRLVVRNGHLPPRVIQSAIGPIRIRQPRVLDHRVGEDGRRLRFTSRIVRPYVRSSGRLGRLTPGTYLTCLSRGDLCPALEALMDREPAVLPPSVFQRLRPLWRAEHQVWSRRRLSDRGYERLWADELPAEPGDGYGRVLVLGAWMGSGGSELVAVREGRGGGVDGWHDLLLDVEARGLRVDGGTVEGRQPAGFRGALRHVLSRRLGA